MFENLKKYVKGDSKLWFIIIFLSIMSVLAVYSATGTLAYKSHGGHTSSYMFKQFLSILGGIGIIIFMSNIHYRHILKFSPAFLWVSIGLLFCVLIFGKEINNASRTLDLPFINIRFQPSELAKIALIIYVARTLGRNQDNREALAKSFIPIMFNTLVVIGLIFKDNLSTALLIFVVVMVLMIIGGMPFRYIFGTGFAAVVLLALILMLAPKISFLERAMTWRARIERFIAPEKVDKEVYKTMDYQSYQAKIAVSTGGIRGKGPGNSEQRNFLPHCYSDFIYAIIAEEYGFLGALLTLVAYFFLLARIGVTATKSSRASPAFMIMGLGFLLVSQALINMGVSVGILPVTGQPLPLVSWGTSSIVATSIALGIILGVTHQNINEKNEKNTELEITK